MVVVALVALSGCAGGVVTKESEPTSPAATLGATSTSTAATATTASAPAPWPVSMIPPGEVVFNCAGICLGEADGSDVDQVASDAADASWSPDGALLAYRRSADAFRVDFDRELVVRDVASGEERVVAEFTEILSSARSPVWSYDGSILAVRSDHRESPTDILIAASDGSWSRPLTDDESREGLPTWSPVDLRLAYVSERDGTPDVYIVDIVAGTQIRVTNDDAFEFGLVWLSDGRLVFIKNGDLYVLALDTLAEFQLTTTGNYFHVVPQGDITLPVSPDGKCVAAVFGPSGGATTPEDSRIHVLCLDGVELTGIVDAGNGTVATWTGDSRFLLTHRWDETGAELYSVWMVDLATGQVAPFPLPPRSATAYSWAAWAPRWRPQP